MEQGRHGAGSFVVRRNAHRHPAEVGEVHKHFRNAVDPVIIGGKSKRKPTNKLSASSATQRKAARTKRIHAPVHPPHAADGARRAKYCSGGIARLLKRRTNNPWLVRPQETVVRRLQQGNPQHCRQQHSRGHTLVFAFSGHKVSAEADMRGSRTIKARFVI